MDLKCMTSDLKREVQGERNRRRFDEAKRRHSVLGHHEEVDSVLAVLGDESAERYWEREAITRALIVEHQRRPHRLWSAMLTIAYYPMLCRLRVRTRSDAVTPAELDQLVVVCFLEVLERIPMEPRRDKTSVRLRSKTRRRVFGMLRREQGRQDELQHRTRSGPPRGRRAPLAPRPGPRPSRRAGAPTQEARATSAGALMRWRGAAGLQGCVLRLCRGQRGGTYTQRGGCRIGWPLAACSPRQVCSGRGASAC